MFLIRQADFVDRNCFADFLNRTGRTGIAVEVGTHRADFAFIFLNNWRGETLHCIDPWESTPEYAPQEAMLPDKGKDRQEDFRHTSRLLKQFVHAKSGPTASILRMTSEVASNLFRDGTVDFVYLDGDHRTEEVYKDLERWYPKLKDGGVIAGHDFLCPTENNDGWGGHIQPAVFKFALRVNATAIYLVLEPTNLPWSFYLVRE